MNEEELRQRIAELEVENASLSQYVEALERELAATRDLAAFYKDLMDGLVRLPQATKIGKSTPPHGAEGRRMRQPPRPASDCPAQRAYHDRCPSDGSAGVRSPRGVRQRRHPQTRKTETVDPSPQALGKAAARRQKLLLIPVTLAEKSF